MRIGRMAVRGALLGGAVLALAACGSGGTTGGGGGLLATGVASKWTKDDACKTLPKEAVAAATGEAVTAAENVDSGTPDTSVATCTYTMASGQLAVLLRSSDSEMNDTEIGQLKDAGGLMPGGVDEPGLGMKAYWNPKTRQLQVVPDRKHYFNITYGTPLELPGMPKPPTPEKAKAVTTALAKQLL